MVLLTWTPHGYGAHLSALLSPFSLFLLSSPSPSPVLCRGRGHRHRWPAMPDGQATPRTTPRPACARHRPVPSPRPRLGHARALPARRTRPCRPPRRALRPSPRALPYPALPSLTCFASTPPASLFPPRAKPSSSRSPERRRCPLGCRGSSVRPASERGPWRSVHAHGARAAQRRDGLARQSAGVGGQEASGAGQGHGEAHRPSSAWGAAARRRVDDVRWRWRWSSAEEDLR